MDQARCMWKRLMVAGATVPLDPVDLDATHLILAAASGVDVHAIIEATMPLSVGEPERAPRRWPHGSRAVLLA